MSRVFAVVLVCLAVFGMLIFGCAGQKAPNVPPLPAPPVGAACSSYSSDTCPASCVVCPPCAECSSISCQTEQFCKNIGFDRSWYEGIKQNLASAQGQGNAQAGEIRSPTDAELARVVENFDAYAENARKDWNVTGMSITIVKGDKVLLLKGYGAKSVGGGSVTPNTVFSIGSTSKAFASTLVAMEVEKGAMEWDGKIKQYMPDFQMNDSWVTNEMTVTDALAHHSGLPDHWGDEIMYIGYNSSYMAHALRYAVPATSFRSKYEYQNTVYSLPSLIIEKITGKSWGENLKEQIFSPLGMESSSADYDSLMAAKDVATPYAYVRSADGSLSPEQVAWDSTIVHMAYWEPGAGGVNSNAADMSKWLIFQMGNGTYNGKQLLTAANLNYVHSPKTPLSNNMENPGFYTQGWVYQETKFGPMIGHSGAIGGYHTSVSFMPKENVGIVILTNNVESSLSDALSSQFLVMYFGNTSADLSAPMLKSFKVEKAAESTKTSPTPATPALQLSAYAGSYTNIAYGTAVVAMENGNLTATFGPAKIKLPLVPIGGNKFAHPGTPTDDMMFTSNPFEFGVENGAVKSLVLRLNAENVTFEQGQAKTGPASDGITISIVPQKDAGAALESGKLDYYLSPLAAADVQEINSNPSTAVELYPAVSTFMGIYFNPAPANVGINPFSSQKARFALNFLIDRGQIAQDVYGGAAFPVLSIPYPGHPSYAPISSAVDSFNITYDKAKGTQLLNEAMAEQGAAMVNGTWSYNGKPITIIMPLYNGSGATGTRFMFASMVANDLKAAGFAVQMPTYDDYNVMPQYATDPVEMKWNIDISGAVFYGASKYQSAFFLAPDRQDGWWQYNNTAITAAGELMGNATTKAEWDGANELLARLYINDSVGMWLVALDSNYGAGKDVQGIVDNRFVGIGDYGTARQASVNGKASLAIGMPDLYDGKVSWNPAVVESIYAMGLLNTIHDPAWTADPVTLEEKPYRWGFAIERYPAPQALPQGAFMWSVEGKKWVATPANATAKTKVAYDLSGYIGANWHNGQAIGWSDVLYFLASTSDRVYDTEKQKIASDQYKGTLDTVVGYRINGNLLETYLNTQDLDNGNLLAVARMFQRVAPFEIYAADDAVVFAQKKYSYGDVPASPVPPLSLVNSTHVGDVLAAMGSLTDAQIAPMVTADGTDYLGSNTLSSRLNADKAWNAAHSSLVISDGAFYLDYYNQTDGSAHLKAFRDPSYPFVAGAWLQK